MLVIDDDDSVGKKVALHLRERNYRVSCVYSGTEACALIARDAPDLVVLDHYLPDTTGAELLEKLRDDIETRAIPVIYLTIDGSHQRFRRSMTRGADDFLLTDYMQASTPKKDGRVFIVHRLDRDASGLMLFAKNPKAKNFLQEHWETFTKKYFAVVFQR